MTQENQDTLVIEDLNEFVYILEGWHNEIIKVLEHMLEVPEGTVMEVDGVDYVLTGDLLAAFKAGLDLALIELGKLPFTCETDPPDAANDITLAG